MPKAEPQQANVQNQSVAHQRSGLAAAPVQTEQTAQLEAMRASSPRQRAAQQMAHNINNSPMMVAQAQRHERMTGVGQRVAKPNQTGLPDQLKSGIENLSGMSMDHVKVHYNSSQPAQLNALAYAQGSEIHVAPGQEQHLPHEAWHVVQQAQGRVKPTMQMKGGVPVNDDEGLEREADVMGGKALQAKLLMPAVVESNSSQIPGSEVIQRQIFYDNASTEFQVDGKKPSFVGSVKAMVLLASQSRDHIIPYAAIENDLAVLLNQWIGGTTLLPVIQSFTEALFPNKGPLAASYIDMVAKRNILVATLNAGITADYQKHARALLSRLNSSSDNIRTGDSALNSSIGENLDTDFIAGYQVVPLAGLNVTGNTGAIFLPANTNYLRLQPNSEAVLWEYQTRTTQDLSFVLNPSTNTQVSSVDAPMPSGGGLAPTVSGLPVIVFDPLNVGLPFYYH